MNLLLALLAFAGLMAFLSTSVSILIEGVNKVFAWRRAGLEEALRTLHADVLSRLGPAPEGEAGETGPQFAKAMTENVAFGGRGRFWWLRNLPVISWLFTRKSEKLSTLQFVENYARTPAGKRLAGMDQAQLRRALTVAAYEFERYCDAQSAYFKRRAQILSVLVAMSFALVANIDSFFIFERLVRDPAVTGMVLGVATPERIDSQEQALAEERAAGSEGAAQRVRENAAEAVIAAQQFADAGLPMGFMAFPYCLSNPVLIRAHDPRCGAAEELTPRDAPVGVVAGRALQRLLAPGGGGAVWLFSVLVAGGLIGLGAPFWFDFFRKLARIAPSGERVQAVLGGEPAPAPAGRAAQQVVRDRNAANPHALVLAYRVASGEAAAAAADPALDVQLDPPADAGGVQRFRRPL